MDDAVQLAKRASVGQVSIRDLKVAAAKYSGHVVEVSGIIGDPQSKPGAGYTFTVDDGSKVSVTYQGLLGEIRKGDTVKVTGVYDAQATRSSQVA